MSTRIKGKKIAFEIDGEDYWADLTSVALDNEEADSDVTTFEDAAQDGGARQYFLEMSAVQSTDTESFWRAVWDNTGTEVPFKFAPHGNTTPTTAQPHFTGSCVVGPRPRMGGDPATDWTFETRFNVEGTPVLDDGA